MPCRLFLLSALALIIPGATALTQGVNEGGWTKLGAGRGPGVFEPEAMFKQLAGGAASIDVSRVEVPAHMSRWTTAGRLRARMQAHLQKNGVTTGRMTFEHYKAFSEEHRQEVMARDRAMRSGLAEESADALLEALGLRPAAPAAGPGGLGESRPGGALTPSVSGRAAVYRPGNLPLRWLPEWYTRLDTDKDAQVGLYEWLADGRPVTEFEAMDANGDGFVTVEEYLRLKSFTEAKGPGRRGSVAGAPAR